MDSTTEFTKQTPSQSPRLSKRFRVFYLNSNSSNPSGVSVTCNRQQKQRKIGEILSSPLELAQVIPHYACVEEYSFP